MFFFSNGIPDLLLITEPSVYIVFNLRSIRIILIERKNGAIFYYYKTLNLAGLSFIFVRPYCVDRIKINWGSFIWRVPVLLAKSLRSSSFPSEWDSGHAFTTFIYDHVFFDSGVHERRPTKPYM